MRFVVALSRSSSAWKSRTIQATATSLAWAAMAKMQQPASSSRAAAKKKDITKPVKKDRKQSASKTNDSKQDKPKSGRMDSRTCGICNRTDKVRATTPRLRH